MLLSSQLQNAGTRKCCDTVDSPRSTASGDGSTSLDGLQSRPRCRRLGMVVRSGVAPLSPAEGNRSAYRQQAIVEIMRQREGWIDPAERILLNRIADEVGSQPILDIGVGGGRTSWILRLLSADYTAVDRKSTRLNSSH